MYDSRKQGNIVVCNLPTTSFVSFMIELVILRERGAQQRGAFLLFKNALVTLEPVKTIQVFEHSEKSTPKRFHTRANNLTEM